ncbi:MAG: aminopeptidase P family protein [Deltaproteobacteria bacterium]|nr:aminopeptidase P family protein [Deltaproteobacteria bacterium]
MEYHLVASGEIFARISRLQDALVNASLSGALVVDRINLYYFTGTIQKGILFVPKDGEAVFFIRRSLERAQKETALRYLVGFEHLDEVANHLKALRYDAPRLGIDESSVSVSEFKRVSRLFPDSAFEDIAWIIAGIRAVKSDYEVGLIREAGRRHKALYDQIPEMIEEGMTEWELASRIQRSMLSLGFTGVCRLADPSTELFAGAVNFGESGNYPTASVGPDGLVGQCAAFPFFGGHRELRPSEPIFVDTAFACQGYYTDKTRIFCLGSLPQQAVDAHQRCLEIQEAIRSRLVPGVVVSDLYEAIYEREVVGRGFTKGFMGFGTNQVRFLGHGIGLVIDEFPAIASKVKRPLKKNMVIALEPKKALEGIGLVGIENTFLVTEHGGERLTPGDDEIVTLS